MISKKTLVALLTVVVLMSAGVVVPQSGGGSYESLKAEAERYYAEKSFSRAQELYAQIAKLELTAGQRRWVELRLGDTAWRAETSESAVRTEAQARLQKLITETPADAHDRIWAEANESLGDSYAFHPHYQNVQAALGFYTQAMDWWAGQSDLTLARSRYLGMVWKLTPNNQTWHVQQDVLANAVKIAEAPADKARARFLLANSLIYSGRDENVERGLELLDEVISFGRSEWYDDALFLAGVTLAQHSELGVISAAEEDAPRENYAKALGFFRRLITEFKPGETPHFEAARDQIWQITNPTVSVQVAGTFLPGVEQDVLLSWRNVRQVELSLTAADLTKIPIPQNTGQWKDALTSEGRPPLRRWTYDTGDKGDHHPRYADVRMTPRLEPGAYILSARAAGSKGKAETALVLVTDAHILVHDGRAKTHVFVSHVLTGEPIANARVRLATMDQQPKEVFAQTNANGVAELSTPSGGSMLVTAAAGSRQAFHQTWTGYFHHLGQRAWRIYAFTDRPAYRPGETVQWKILARTREDERWSTPAAQSLRYEIISPRGEKVSTGTAKLNAFGSLWAELPLTTAMPLGAYQIVFYSSDHHVGAAMLFRLEEYKLPEFTVSVTTPEGKQYRLGETIEAQIEANYYFGGPVANAEVQVVVHQSQFHRYWNPWREHSWYWKGYMPSPPPESVMTRETLRTDATGRAVLRIETPRDSNDLSYRIEARVVDASRREVRGEGTVRVTKQRYTVLAQPAHYLHRPGENVEVTFKAMDANDRPVQATGTVRVFQRRWREDALRRGTYAEEEVFKTQVKTDTEGKGDFTFTPKREGYYVVRWVSVDGDARRAQDLVRAETTVWVAERSTIDLGYHAGGLELIIDKESLRQGQTASVLVVTPSTGRWVVLTSSGDDILDTQVLRLDGTVKLVQIPIDERHVPNFFITASSIFDRQLAMDHERLVVPPIEHFLTVDVQADREQYQPREEGTLTVTTRDASGKPLAAEVAVSLADEAVTAIQADPAGDPREFFFGDVREPILRVTAGLQSQRYITREDEEREREAKEQERQKKDGEKRERDGYVGFDAVREAISVTAEAPAMMPQAIPAPPPAPALGAMAKSVANEEAAPQIEVQVRSDFRSTAFWKPDVVTSADGMATIKVKFPEALTTWRATARGATAGAVIGMGSSTVRTNLPLIVRLQAPRFFVTGDQATVSAVINNNTDQAMTVTPSIDVEGLTLHDTKVAAINVPAHGEARADWTVVAGKAGNARLRVTGRSATHGDAMEKPFVVYDHGIDKLIARSGKLRGDEALIRLDLPRERRGSDLTVQVAPSLAVTMLDALPYLIQFPYGCTEQTMSRFLPAAIVARTIEKLGLGRARLAGKDLDAVTAAGMARLYDMQHGDGGWGWWKDGNSDDFMTAYVVWGFAVAREGGLKVNTGAVDRAVAWLERRLVHNENQWSDQAWMLHAMSAWRAKPSAAERKAYDNVWTNRERLTAYSRALLALTAHRYGDKERTAVLVRNLEDGARIDRTPDQSVLLKGETTAETMATAHWGAPRFWWRWYEGPVETTAFVLQALVTIDPKHRLVEPTMNWLVKNRRGSQWNNTRDTAIALLALNDYLVKSGEAGSEVSYEISVNGKVVATKTIKAADILSAPSRFPVDAALLADTTQEIRIRRTGGNAPIYFSAEARFFSLEEPVKAAGNEIFVRRQYFRLKPRPTLLKGILYDRVPLKDGESVVSGERIDVVVTVDTKNDYSYLMFEDLKPAGFEAVALQSGQPLWATETKTKETAWVYQELRDRKVAMFLDHAKQGMWELTYTLRAETPGSFHALPLLAQAMYVPDVRANGDEVRVRVTERE